MAAYRQCGFFTHGASACVGSNAGRTPSVHRPIGKAWRSVYAIVPLACRSCSVRQANDFVLCPNQAQSSSIISVQRWLVLHANWRRGRSLPLSRPSRLPGKTLQFNRWHKVPLLRAPTATDRKGLPPPFTPTGNTLGPQLEILDQLLTALRGKTVLQSGYQDHDDTEVDLSVVLIGLC